MPNPLKGEVPLTIGQGEKARAFTLVLDHEALIEAEAAYGKPLAMLMAHATLGFAGACRAMLYGALRRHHPEVTLGEAAALFLDHMDTVGPALEAAAEASFPKAAEGKEGANPRPGRRRGTSSSGNGAKRGSSSKRSSARPRASTG